jgi:hypothetical protein
MINQRRARVRQFSDIEVHEMNQRAHEYRLKQYARLLRLGASDVLAEQAFEIWENGFPKNNSKTTDTPEQKKLDEVSVFLEKRLQPAVLAVFPIAS